ncbi:MAG TPA: PEP-CTERM sorting domain-containing protein [Pyrinomonadaceae bacterium]|nr:PEP-CTERM sorting domain-containing protein [Pyrinomonadaceae bacterium]
MRYFLFIVLLVCCYTTVHADPIILGDTNALHYVNGTGNIEDFLSTPLTSHPDIVAAQPFAPGNVNGHVSFFTFLQGPAGTLFRAEWFYDGQLLGVDDFFLPFDFGADTALVYGREFPLSYDARVAVLNLSFGNQTATYTFTVREPVPEPATLGLLALGSVAFGYFRRRQVKASSRKV